SYASVPQQMQCRRAATLEAELSWMESRLATQREQGEEPSTLLLDLYSRLAGNQRRHLEAIGWRPHQRNLNEVSLASVLERHGQEKNAKVGTGGPEIEGVAHTVEDIEIDSDSGDSA